MTVQNLRKRLISLVAAFVLLPLNACVSVGDKNLRSETAFFAQDPNRVRPCEDVLNHWYDDVFAPPRGMGRIIFPSEYENCIFQSGVISEPCRVGAVRPADVPLHREYDKSKCALELLRFIDLPTTTYPSRWSYDYYLTFSVRGLGRAQNTFCADMSDSCEALAMYLLDEAYRAQSTDVQEITDDGGTIIGWVLVHERIASVDQMMGYLYKYVYDRSKDTAETNRFGCELLKRLVAQHGPVPFTTAFQSAEHRRKLLTFCGV